MGDAVIIDDQAQDYPLYVRSESVLKGIVEAKPDLLDVVVKAVVVYDDKGNSKEYPADEAIEFAFITKIATVEGYWKKDAKLWLNPGAAKFEFQYFDGTHYVYLFKMAGPILNITVHGDDALYTKKLVVKV